MLVGTEDHSAASAVVRVLICALSAGQNEAPKMLCVGFGSRLSI
ncbi:hypothetical protein [Mesorhizobium sp. M0195]